MGRWPPPTLGEDPDQLRGPQHHKAWADEAAKWRYAEDAWDNMEFGLRLGEMPQVIATTTPRPIKLLRDLITQENQPHGTAVTRGSTYENIANLAPGFIARVVGRYEGTRRGRQELHAELLDDTPGALWTREMLDTCRVSTTPTLQRIAAGPRPGRGRGHCRSGAGEDGRAYVLEDLSSRAADHLGPPAVGGYHTFGENVIVAEADHGGLQAISQGMIYNPTRLASCPSRWLNLVCKIPISLLVYQRLL